MNGWKLLQEFLARKWNAPKQQPTFWFFLAGAVFLAGGCGIWVSIGQSITAMHAPNATWNWQPLIASLYTYFPALAAASAFDLLLLNEQRYVRSLAFLCVIIIVTLAALAIWLKPGFASFLTCVFGYLLSVALWFFANAENQSLREPTPPLAATGEDQPRQLAGGLENFDRQPV